MRLVLRHPRFWLGAGWTLVIAAIVVSLMPGHSLPQTGFGDKVEHALAYTFLTLWFTGIYPRSSYARIGLGMLALGIGLEIAQGMLPFGRQMDFRDVIANSLGIALGLAIALMGLGGWAQRIEAWVRRG